MGRRSRPERRMWRARRTPAKTAASTPLIPDAPEPPEPSDNVWEVPGMAAGGSGTVGSSPGDGKGAFPPVEAPTATPCSGVVIEPESVGRGALADCDDRP